MATTNQPDGFLTPDDKKILVHVCAEVGVEPDLVEQMIAAESRVYGMGRRHTIFEFLENAITKAVDPHHGKKGGSR
jgi:hypothetical protein